jgi:single-strand DNA-binding protein
MNKFIGLGNLTRDPELRFTPKGTAVCNVGLALNRKWRTESGEDREDVTFLDCTIWGATAEATSKYCKKGKRVLVEGRLAQQTWEDKETHKQRSKIIVQVEQIQFLGSPDSASASRPTEGGYRSTASPAGRAASQPSDSEPPPDSDDSVPF